MKSKRLIYGWALALVCASSVTACGGGEIGDRCNDNLDCDLRYCDPVLGVCGLARPPDDSGTAGTDAAILLDGGPGADSTPGVDSGPGFDNGVIGTDANTPFDLVPSLTSVDASWACSATGTLPFTGTSAVVFQTDSGEIFDLDNGVTLRPAGTGIDGTSGVRFEIAPQTGGIMVTPLPSIGVFAFTDLTLPAGVTAFVSGTNALGLLACGEAHISGVIDVSAELFNGGPGAWNGGTGIGRPAGNGAGAGTTGGEAGVSNVTPSNNESGGGGGGFGGIGGHGGACVDDPGGAGGASSVVATLDLLRGGGGGGSGGCTGADGGGGGGAVYVGASGGIWIEGAGAGITAGGAGGRGCPDFAANGGGGGGAGGAIFLEGPSVTVGGGATLAANGGGGGGGSGGTPGGDGEGGLLSGTRASGGAGPGGGFGGEGGALGGPDGLAGGSVTDGAGGGGGGAGRIRINTASGSASISGTVSPGAGDSGPAGQALFSQGVAPSS